MSNVDKVMNVWKDLEKTYSKKGDGLSKRDFLVKLLGDDKSMIRLRQMMMKDYNGSEEVLNSINGFLSVLDGVRSQIETTEQIDNLNVFVWGTPLGLETLDLTDFTVVAKEKKYESGAALIRDGYFGSVFKLKDGKVVSRVLNPDDGMLLRFSTEGQVLNWLTKNTNSIESNRNSFKDMVYAYLIKRILERSVVLPLTFVNGKCDDGKVTEYDKEFPTLSKGTNLHCSFTCTETTREDYQKENMVYLL